MVAALIVASLAIWAVTPNREFPVEQTVQQKVEEAKAACGEKYTVYSKFVGHDKDGNPVNYVCN